MDQILFKSVEKCVSTGSISFVLFCRMPFTLPIFMLLQLAQQVSVKNSCTKFHENLMNVSVADGMSQPDGWLWSHKMFIFPNKECLKYVRRTNKMHTFFLHWFHSTILSSTCFEQLSLHHQQDCTNSFMVFYQRWRQYTVVSLYPLIHHPRFQLSTVYCDLKKNWKIKEINGS
jgi:hypothetical protein